MFLLDTNVISELVRPSPDRGVEACVRKLPPDEIFTSSICEAELRYGLAKMPMGSRRSRLLQSIDSLLTASFGGSILPFDRACAQMYGQIRAGCEAAGKPIDLGDGMITAAARVHAATLVTRNVRHFAHCGIAILDPWARNP